MKYIFLSISLCFLFGCSPAPDNIPNTPRPELSVTPSIDVEKRRNDKVAARDLAVADFIAKNFKGWTLNGTNTEFGICGEDDDDPCYLHLVKGSGAKVVPVMIREFEKSDKSTYWLVYEAHSVDIARAKIARGKEIAREEGSQDANSTESR